MRHLIVGLGEVGDALRLVLNKEVDVQYKDQMDARISSPIDFMHIAIPYTEDFVEIVTGYIREYQPKHTIVYSSVPVGTCDKLGENVAHSPVEGIHPHLKTSFKRFVRWIGGSDKTTNKAILNLWSKYARCKVVNDAKFTEFLKLQSTSKYGINIVWADYANDVAKKLGMDYEYVKEFDRNYNDLYAKLNRPHFRRYVLDPPNGKIGGHCVTSNAKLLNEDFPDDMLDMIEEME